MYRYVLSDAAKRDLRQIAEYIAIELSAPDSAEELIIKLQEAFRHACLFPDSIPPVNDELFRARGYRKIIVNNYVAFVLIDHGKETVNIVRVLYYRQDYQKIL